MFRALRLRLAVGNALILAFLLTGLSFAGLQLFQAQVDDEATVELEAIADEFSALLAREGVAGIPNHHRDPSDAAVLVGVFDRDGTYLGGTAERPTWLGPRTPRVTDTSIDGDPVRFVTEPTRLSDGKGATIVVARSLQRLEGAVAELRSIFVNGMVAVLLLSGLFGWWISGRMIQPIARSYEAQRTFAADASHELRTPLTFIRAGVEVLAPARPELGTQVLEEVGYMTALTERLLLLARSHARRRGRAAHHGGRHECSTA